MNNLIRIAIGVLTINIVGLALGIIWGGPRYILLVGAVLFLSWILGTLIEPLREVRNGRM